MKDSSTGRETEQTSKSMKSSGDNSFSRYNGNKNDRGNMTMRPRGAISDSSSSDEDGEKKHKAST